MQKEPLSVAIRAIAETRQLLENVILSSENFRYREAKEALKALDRKVRELARLQNRLVEGPKASEASIPNLCVVDFSNPQNPRGTRAH